MVQYWYNVRTHEVEEDAQSDWSQLIGPYNTRAEAERALEKVQERNRAWEAQDEE
ncbi:SPOR domain-containing protein [Arthrobacter sp.]|uniref:SPOR domain-containing protein n=1 Tax=Arthrobacter sp. TaxID=1667 RepID=UPI002811F953|nr:SPOR domain-containing protein [Arthrobacter sp.]